MADTKQSVTWWLEHACPFRAGPAAESPPHSLYPLYLINVAAQNNDLYGDHIVIGESYFQGARSPVVAGCISQAIAPAGTLENARRLCAECPANTYRSDTKLAGCWGLLRDWFSRDSDTQAKDLHQRIAQAIADLHLQSQVAATFFPTGPPWYGFWSTSPLSPDQVLLLQRILPLANADGDAIGCFRNALAIAAEKGLPLHIRLAPPGHTDFGTRSTYAHCPRCQMEAGAPGRKAPDKPLTCRCCGHVFVPSQTEHQEEENCDSDATGGLSPDEYHRLRDEWKQRHGGDVSWDPLHGPQNKPGVERGGRAWRREINLSILAMALAVIAHSIGGIALLIYHWSRLEWSDRFADVFVGLVLLPVSAALAAVVGLFVTRSAHRLLGHSICDYCQAPLPTFGHCQCHAAREYRECMSRLARKVKAAERGNTAE